LPALKNNIPQNIRISGTLIVNFLSNLKRYCSFIQMETQRDIHQRAADDLIEAGLDLQVRFPIGGLPVYTDLSLAGPEL
jgi:hypothetical protein